MLHNFLQQRVFFFRHIIVRTLFPLPFVCLASCADAFAVITWSGILESESLFPRQEVMLYLDCYTKQPALSSTLNSRRNALTLVFLLLHRSQLMLVRSTFFRFLSLLSAILVLMILSRSLLVAIFGATRISLSRTSVSQDKVVRSCSSQ